MVSCRKSLMQNQVLPDPEFSCGIYSRISKVKQYCLPTILIKKFTVEFSSYNNELLYIVSNSMMRVHIMKEKRVSSLCVCSVLFAEFTHK
jgi:hypothetical protein